MKEINTENFEIITKHKQKNNENEKNNINTNENILNAKINFIHII